MHSILKPHFQTIKGRSQNLRGKKTLPVSAARPGVSIFPLSTLPGQECNPAPNFDSDINVIWKKSTDLKVKKGVLLNLRCISIITIPLSNVYPGGHSPENALKTPFSSPPDRSLRPHFKIFQFFKTLYLPEITILWKISISEPQNWGKIQFSCLEFQQILVPRAWKWTKISFLRPKFGGSSFSKPRTLISLVDYPHHYMHFEMLALIPNL